MKKLFFTIMLLSVLPAAFAQSIALNFDTPLPAPNMDYTQTIDTGNYSFHPNNDSWNETRLYGRKEADSSYTGFNYSNVQDSVTPGKINDRAAFPAIGYNNSPQYGIAHGVNTGMHLDLHIGVKPTRSTYVYDLQVANATVSVLSMEHGDTLGKKFGGADGTEPDWLLLTIKGYQYFWGPDSVSLTDSVEVYLADFRSPDSTEDYILKTWKRVDLASLGQVDSLSFHLSSSDTDSAGMKTPAYFCIDEMGVQFVGGITSNKKNTLNASIYPNPVSNQLYIKATIPVDVSIYDISGRLKKAQDRCKYINVADLATGVYLIKVTDEKTNRSSSFTFNKTP